MLSEQVIEQLVERLTKRIEETNVRILKKISIDISSFRNLTETEAQQLAQILKYGGSYQEIVKEISKMTNLNTKDIEDIFEGVAKKNQMFAKQFYDYKGIDFIPYKDNVELQRQVKAIASITKGTYRNLSRSLGYTTIDRNGRPHFTKLARMYQDSIDRAVLSVAQGKDTFDNEMQRMIKQYADSGIKTVDYQSGRSIRFDSVVRRNMQQALRNMSNDLQQQFGEEFGADGVEISVHSQPAPDHAYVQGRQFTNEEFEKYQNHEDAKDTTGTVHYGQDHRAISEYNCYHYIFSVILGVNKPIYSDKQLEDINSTNEEGFTIDGKKYTLYEGTQMQRKLELEIRKAKDNQIASINQDDKMNSQKKINQLTTKYNDLCRKSGLKRKANRMRVSGYKKVATK